MKSRFRLLSITFLLLTLVGIVTVGTRAKHAAAQTTAHIYTELLVHDSEGVLYAAGQDVDGASVLDIVDLDTLAVIETIDLPFRPQSLALSADGDELAVGGLDPAGIAFLTPENRQLTGPLSMPEAIHSLAFGAHGRLFVAHAEPESPLGPAISVVDVISDNVVGTVPLSAPADAPLQLEIGDEGAALFALVSGASSPIFRMNALSDTLPIVAQTQDALQRNVMAVAGDGGRVFTEHEIWNGTLAEILHPVYVPSAAIAGRIVYEPALDRVFLQIDDRIEVYDAQTGQSLDRLLPEERPTDFAVSASRERVYYATLIPTDTIKVMPWSHHYSFLPVLGRAHEPVLVYADDFSNPDSGWPIDEIPELRLSYQAGEYELLVRESEWWVAVVGPVALDQIEYRLETRVRQAAPALAIHGIIFDWRDWDNFTLLAILPAESIVGLYGVVNGDLIAYQEWLPYPVAAVEADWHDIRLERLEGRTVAWIDGAKVIDVAIGVFPGQVRVGYYVEAWDQVPALLRADQITIHSLPGAYDPPARAVKLSPAPAPLGAPRRLLGPTFPQRLWH